jgi:hypothetical protein
MVKEEMREDKNAKAPIEVNFDMERRMTEDNRGKEENKYDPMIVTLCGISIDSIIGE